MIQRAIRFAIQAHTGQVRKGTVHPYIEHKQRGRFETSEKVWSSKKCTSVYAGFRLHFSEKNAFFTGLRRFLLLQYTQIQF